MVNHLFKLIWKRRKSNFLIMLEIFVAFMILFAVSSLSIYFLKNYAQPMGINTNNVWAVYVNYNAPSDSLNKNNGELIAQRLKSFKEIESYSFGWGTFPFGNSHSNRGFDFNGKNLETGVMDADENYPSVLGLQLSEGSWFKNTDTTLTYTPVVITQCLKEELYGKENAIGKYLQSENIESNKADEAKSKKEKIVGILTNFKHDSDFSATENTIITPFNGWKSSFLMKVTPSVSAEFEAQFAKSLRQLGKDWTIEVLHMDEMRTEKNQFYMIPLTMALIVSGFLIFNVAFGLFGVLFQNINRRRGEIGLRRAMGATGRDISFQFVSEMAVLATFAIALGVFFAVQFPILNVFDVATSVYIWGVIIAVASVYGLVLLCSWLPSRQAAAIHPAVALHED
jgi:putative ABC transport system permease protein